MEISAILRYAAEHGASDVYLVGGLPLTYKIDGRQRRDQDRLMPGDIERLVEALYALVGRARGDRSPLCVEDDFSFALSGCGRFRANVFYQRGSLAAVIRVIQFGVPDPDSLHIPRDVLSLARLGKGLVLVTGPAGSGKTSTLACILDAINDSGERTIITMEDPIEIVHSHKQSIVIQREIGIDTESYMSALRAALRESPDVLLLGEIRDAQTMEVAMTAAETGQLLFSSLHTLSAADTIDRIVDFFSAARQPQVRAQLSRVLRSVVCQQLIPAKNGRLVPAFEILHVTPAVRSLIREGKTYQFASVIQENGKLGMCSMNMSLLQLVTGGQVEAKTALEYSENPEQLEKRLNGYV